MSSNRDVLVYKLEPGFHEYLCVHSVGYERFNLTSTQPTNVLVQRSSLFSSVACLLPFPKLSGLLLAVSTS